MYELQVRTAQPLGRMGFRRASLSNFTLLALSNTCYRHRSGVLLSHAEDHLASRRVHDHVQGEIRDFFPAPQSRVNRRKCGVSRTFHTVTETQKKRALGGRASAAAQPAGA